MILYHGSNINIEHIELEKSKPFKDFGKGFYLSESEEQALEMALRHCLWTYKNDKVGLQIRKLKDGSIDKTEFLNRLKYMKGITFQYFFGTKKAIKHLIRL